METPPAFTAGRASSHRPVQSPLLSQRRNALGLRQIDTEQEAPCGMGARPLRPVGTPLAAQDRDRAVVAAGAEAHVP